MGNKTAEKWVVSWAEKMACYLVASKVARTDTNRVDSKGRQKAATSAAFSVAEMGEKTAAGRVDDSATQ